jgi:hypothetical protein
MTARLLIGAGHLRGIVPAFLPGAGRLQGLGPATNAGIAEEQRCGSFPPDAPELMAVESHQRDFGLR